MATRKKSLTEGPEPEDLAEPTGDWIEILLADARDLEGRWQAVNEATAARIGTFHKALVKASRAPVAQRDQRARDLAQAALNDRDLADLWPPIRRALHLAGPAPEAAPAPRKKTLFFEGGGGNEDGRETLLAIPLALIRPGNNPRKTFDEGQLLDLAESIRAHGQQVPALVRRVGDGFELVAGERRWRACELAGVPTLLARLVELDDRAALEVALVENSARADVHPLEEADALAQLLEMGSDVEDLRVRLNRGEQWVRDRLALRTLHPTLREAFKAGRLTLRAAVVLAHLPEERQAGIGERHRNEALSYRDALHLARRESPTLASLLFDLHDATLGGHGACVTCLYRTDKQPDLLNPDGGAIRCTDGACADKKTNQWVEIEEAGGTKVIRGEARDVLDVDEPSYRVRRALGLGDDDKRPLYELVPDVRRTIHTPSWGRPRLVATAEDIAAALRARGLDAAADIVCPPPEPKTAPARQKRAKEAAVRMALAGLFDAVAADPSVVDMPTICHLLLRNASYNSTNSMLKRRGLDRAPTGTGSSSEQVRALIKEAGAGELVSMVLELLLANDMGFLLSERRVSAANPLVEWMERMGVAIPEHMVAAQ